jgi:predicted TIM-barrel fold metal-dependent hydrolase
MPFPEYHYTKANERIAQAVRENPSKLTGFSYVNIVDEKNVLDEVERSINQLGLKGLMIDVESGGTTFTRSLNQTGQILEKAIDLKVPVLFNTPNIRSDNRGYSDHTREYANMDLLLSRYPHAKIIINLFWPGSTDLAKKHVNLYIDISGCSSGRVKTAVQEMGADRILFGSESPRFHQQIGINAVKMSDISETRKEMILESNAMRILDMQGSEEVS